MALWLLVIALLAAAAIYLGYRSFVTKTGETPGSGDVAQPFRAALGALGRPEGLRYDIQILDLQVVSLRPLTPIG